MYNLPEYNIVFQQGFESNDDEEQLPAQNVFQLDISQIPQSNDKQPTKSVQSLVDQMLFSITNNEVILGNQVIEQEEEIFFEDTMEDFEFREYQLELYEKGRDNNSIIYLETGLGKTLVIMMLMWDRITKFPNKKVVFLANTIQLVEQQGMQIARKLPKVAELLSDDESMVEMAKKMVQNVKIIHGNKCADHWNSMMWQLILEENQIFAMTTQIFLNILRKGFRKLEDFCFIAMDECHNAVQDHPYNYILKEFYFYPKLLNQAKIDIQIVGATASPVMNNRSTTDEQLVKELIQLAANLDSQYLYTDAESVKKHLSEAQIVPVYYSILLNDLEIQKVIDLRSSYDQCVSGKTKVFETMRRYNYLPEFFELKRLIDLFKMKFSNDLSIIIILQQISKQLLQNGFQMYLELGQYVFVLILQFIIQRMTDYNLMKKEKLNDLYLQEIKRALEVLYLQVKSKYESIYASVTPKVQKLFDYLRTAYNEQSKQNMTLIFVKQRVTAYFLNQLLGEYFRTLGIDTEIKSDFIIGINSSIQKRSQTESIITQIDVNPDDEEFVIKTLYDELQRNQNKFSVRELKEKVSSLNIFKQTINTGQSKEKLSKFREGKIKILISTSVAEEGIDIPMCNLVIGFNPIASSKAFVQMKGRARKDKSKFLIFMVQRNESQARLQCHQQIQKSIKKLIQELSYPQRKQTFQAAISKIQRNQIESLFYDQFTIQETGSCINTNWSCVLIQQFCQCVILEGNQKATPRYAIYQFKATEKTQESQYLAFLQLPMQLKNFIFYGQKTSTSKDAKASAALHAAIQLYQKGFLDGQLRPTLNHGFGQHIGADQDDSQIMMTREQQQISQRFSIRIIEKSIYTGLKVNSQKRYYTNKQKSFFIFNYEHQELIDDYIQQTCTFNDETFLIVCPRLLLKQLIDYDLRFVGFSFKETTKITERQYQNYYQKYIRSILDEENLVATEYNTYSTVNSYYQIKVKEIKEKCGNFMFLVRTGDKKKLSLSYIVTQMILGWKVQEFKESLIKLLKQQKLQVDNVLDQVGNTSVNTILAEMEKYFQYITPVKLGVVSAVQDNANYNIIYSVPKQNNNYEVIQNLDQILLQSLNLASPNYNELLLGGQYYNFLVSLTVYANYKNDDSRLAKSKLKSSLSSTYVRNCLLEVYLFWYLHKPDYKDFAKLFVGINRHVDDFDFLMKQQLDDNLTIQSTITSNKQTELQNKVYFSNQEFYQFLEKSLSLIEAEDSDQSQGLLWIKSLNLVNNLKTTISTPKTLSFFLPDKLLNSEQRSALVKSYNALEQQIKYKFNSFELLFQSMTDISFKFFFNNKVKYKYFTQFQTKDEFQGILTELEIEQLKKDFDIMNTTDSSNYENSSLAVLGQGIWSYGLVKLLISKNFDPYTVRILGKLLKDTPFLAFAAIKLKLHLFLNSSSQITIQEIAKQIERCSDQSIAFHISSLSFNQNTEILENAFLALVAAIFLDSGCEITTMFQWQQKILNELQVDQLFIPSYYQRHPKYKFYKWYEMNIGNPFDFNLIKIPHQDYKKAAQGEQLFIPYDMRQASIVNIKRDKYYEIGQLHIYAKSKSQAWDKLYEMIDY